MQAAHHSTHQLTRQMWHLLEPLHASLYYAPEAFVEAALLGYPTRPRWPSYFAWRAAPLGAAGPRLVAATFYSFSPRMIAEHVPNVWEVAAPEKVVAARVSAVDHAWRALLPESIDGSGIREAATLAMRTASAANTAGRPLAAANADIPVPDQPHLQLWYAATLLREHRGDGHITALQAAGLDPCEALVSFAAIGAAPSEVFASRGWTGQEWSAARDRLCRRGWIDANGRATDAGRAGRAEVERLTDELAGEPWRVLGADGCARFAEVVAPLMMAVVASGILPTESTLGIGHGAG